VNHHRRARGARRWTFRPLRPHRLVVMRGDRKRVGRRTSDGRQL